MHNAKSYMVPKMIFANVLAVIMMTFEQHAPADIKEKPQKVIGDQSSQNNIQSGNVQAGGLMNVSDTRPAQAADQANSQKAPAVAKKRMHHTQHAKLPRAQFIHAKSAPVDCCFRGYRS